MVQTVRVEKMERMAKTALLLNLKSERAIGGFPMTTERIGRN
mgnify:CR=1 FL=1